MEVTYHAQTLRLLGITPKVSAKAVKAIEACEAKCGVKLPAAVREWYSLEGVRESLADPDGACGPTSVEQVLAQFERAVSPPRREPHHWIELFGPWEVNTGYQAGLQLDGSEDPPVLEDNADVPRRFIGFIMSTAWWRVTAAGQPTNAYHGWTGILGVCGPPHLDFMLENFELLPVEIEPEFQVRNFRGRAARDPFELRRFRFFRDGGRVEIETKGDPSLQLCPARYMLAADTEPALDALDAFVWPCREVGGPLPPSG